MEGQWRESKRVNPSYAFSMARELILMFFAWLENVKRLQNMKTRNDRHK